jgi:hypothetical protein
MMPPQEPSLLGENNYYSVFFRGNGEAVVSFKAQFTNSGSNPISTVQYAIPQSVSISNIIAFQLNSVTPSPCYQPIYSPKPLGSSTGSANSYPITPTPDAATSENLRSASIITPCYNGQPWYGTTNSYQRADYQLSDKTLIITLPSAVQPNATVNFFVSFRTFDYVKKNLFGAFIYKFETLQSRQPIDSIQIGITTEQNYILKDAKGQVNYGTQAASSALPPSVDSQKGVYNQELDSYYNRIGQGDVYKYASNLAPMESYIVKGAYADSTWKLYVTQIVIGLVIFIVITVIFILIIKRVIRMIKKTNKTTTSKDTAWSKLSQTQRILIVSVGSSLLGATCAVLYTIFIFFFSMYLIPQFSYGYSFEQIFMMLMLVISFGVYVCFLFIPAFVVGLKRSTAWGIATFIFTVMWMLLFAVVFVLISIVFFQQRIYPYPITPGLMGGVDKINISQPQSKL